MKNLIRLVIFVFSITTIYAAWNNGYTYVSNVVGFDGEASFLTQTDGYGQVNAELSSWSSYCVMEKYHASYSVWGTTDAWDAVWTNRLTDEMSSWEDPGLYGIYTFVSDTHDIGAEASIDNDET